MWIGVITAQALYCIQYNLWMQVLYSIKSMFYTCKTFPTACLLFIGKDADLHSVHSVTQGPLHHKTVLCPVYHHLHTNSSALSHHHYWEEMNYFTCRMLHAPTVVDSPLSNGFQKCPWRRGQIICLTFGHSGPLHMGSEPDTCWLLLVVFQRSVPAAAVQLNYPQCTLHGRKSVVLP